LKLHFKSASPVVVEFVSAQNYKTVWPEKNTAIGCANYLKLNKIARRTMVVGVGNV